MILRLRSAPAFVQVDEVTHGRYVRIGQGRSKGADPYVYLEVLVWVLHVLATSPAVSDALTNERERRAARGAGQGPRTLHHPRQAPARARSPLSTHSFFDPRTGVTHASLRIYFVPLLRWTGAPDFHTSDPARARLEAVTRAEITTRDLGEALLADLNVLLQPDPARILTPQHLSELRAAGISWHRIVSLYPLDLTPYAPGVNALVEHEDLYWQMTTERGNSAIERATGAYAHFPRPYVDAKERAIAESGVESGSNLLPLVAFATLIARPEIICPQPLVLTGTLAHTASHERTMRAKVATVSPLVQDLLQWKAQKDRHATPLQHTAY